jgi:hypothetical protein
MASEGTLERHFSKAVGTKPYKKLSVYTPILLTEALGLRIELQYDPAMIARLRHRYVEAQTLQ